MAGAGRARLLQLSCRADQCACTGRVPAPCHRPLATHAAASQPKGSADVDTDDTTGCRLASETDRPPSLAKRSVCRHTPEVGEAMGRAAEVVAPSSSIRTDGGCPVVQVNDLSRSLAAFDPASTLVVVVEMSKASWLVSGVVPGVERQPLKKLEPDATALLRLIERWRNEAVRAGRPIRRIALAYEAGRDGFWLARWLIARGIEAHVIHSASVAVSRERKRAKTDRLDAAMLMRVFLGWLRGERGHCGMVAIPTMEEEDARRPNRERESLVNERSRIVNRMKSALARLGIRGFKPHLRKAPERLAGLRTAEGTGLPANIIEEFRRDMARLALVREQISSIEKTRAERLERAPDTGPHAMVRLLARVIGIGIETADMLVRANEPTAEASTGANAAEPVERRAGAKGNAHQQSTHWTQSQARVSRALERIRQAIAVIHPRWEKLWGGRRRLWHLHRPYEPMEVAPWSKSMISAEA